MSFPPLCNARGDGRELQETLSDLITGTQVLHYQRLIDVDGHLSVRHPYQHNQFIMSRAIAPTDVTCAHDLIQYATEHGGVVRPVGSRTPPPAEMHDERFIHSEIYRQFPRVMAVVHSHSQHVLPYTMNGVPFRPCTRTAAFLGPQPPVFDVRDTDSAETLHHRRDLRVWNRGLGRQLALQFGIDPDDAFDDDDGTHPCHTVVLMRACGFTALGASIPQVVFRAIHTQRNAKILTQALATQAAYYLMAGAPPAPALATLTGAECRDAELAVLDSIQRAWEVWKREVDLDSLYGEQEG